MNQKDTERRLPEHEANNLFNVGGYARGAEPSILSNLGMGILYSVVLITLFCSNWYLFSTSDFYQYCSWSQRTHITYMIEMMSAGERVLLLWCVSLLLYLFFRLLALARVFGRHNGAILVLIPLLVLGLLPGSLSLFDSMKNCLFGLARPVTLSGAFQWQILTDSVGQAGSLCFLACLGFLFRWLAFPKRRFRLFDDGILLSAPSLIWLIGERPFHWHELVKVHLEDPKRGSAGPSVRLEFTGQRSAQFSWQELQFSGEPAELFNAIRTYAPEAAKGMELPSKNIHEVESYTQLWLKYFSCSAVRQRTGALPSGSLLAEGRYEVAGELGAGGQGTAYLAVPRASSNDPTPESHVVLKEYILPVHRGEAIFRQSMEKLQHEAEILRRIDHPSIVRLIDTFVEDHRGYLVLEFVEGRTLKALVQAEGPQPQEVVLEIARQICEILAYLHGLDPPIIHRDLTPDNLILQSNGQVKLVDFNVAHQLESQATATVVGKHAYIPPEQFRGKPTSASDIYALGGTLHYLLTGREPEPLTTSRPAELSADIAPELSAIVARATELDTTRRYRSVAALADELDCGAVIKLAAAKAERMRKG